MRWVRCGPEWGGKPTASDCTFLKSICSRHSSEDSSQQQQRKGSSSLPSTGTTPWLKHRHPERLLPSATHTSYIYAHTLVQSIVTHTLSGSQTWETTLVWKLLVGGQISLEEWMKCGYGFLCVDAYCIMHVCSASVYTDMLCVCRRVALWTRVHVTQKEVSWSSAAIFGHRCLAVKMPDSFWLSHTHTVFCQDEDAVLSWPDLLLLSEKLLTEYYG